MKKYHCGGQTYIEDYRFEDETGMIVVKYKLLERKHDKIQQTKESDKEAGK